MHWIIASLASAFFLGLYDPTRVERAGITIIFG